MTVPLPNWRSIWDRAPCRAVSLAFEGSWLLMTCTLGAASDGANTCAPFGTQLMQFRDYSVGSSNQNTEPEPSVLSKPIWPPWATTISCARAKPRPVPPTRAAGPRWSRKNFSTTCGCSGAGIPSPLSVTDTVTQPAVQVAATTTSPPSGEYLIAFDKR